MAAALFIEVAVERVVLNEVIAEASPVVVQDWIDKGPIEENELSSFEVFVENDSLTG